MMHKKYIFAICYGLLLVCFTIYIALDTFVIKDEYIYVETEKADLSKIDIGDIFATDDKYEDNNIKIEINEYRRNDTTIYVADINLKDSSYLKTAFAENIYGKNIVRRTSTTAKGVNSILAINGDYYGIQENGFVLKNGVIYRRTDVKNRKDLAIYKDGSFELIDESSSNINLLRKNGVYNILSFGPGLIDNGEIIVSKNTKVDRELETNPRTAIGMIDKLHYVFVVSDGRTKESVGLSIYELASFMKELDVKVAYNLDGGGSSAMFFNGKLLNKPTTDGYNIRERGVSDIVYIGY